MTLNDLVDPQAQFEVVGSGYGFTEGPAADAQGNVYFSDGQNDAIHFYEFGKPVQRFANDGTDPVGMIVGNQGDLYVCEGAAGRVVAYEVAGRRKRVLCDQIDGNRFNEPNDLAVDRHDGFYFSDPNYQHRGQPTVMKQDVYYCDAQQRVTRVSAVCFKPNGVLLSADDATLFVADARGQRIYRYDVAAPGRLSNERIWIDRLGANPDGLTLDEHDNLYVCCGKKGIQVFDRSAEPLGRIDVHAANICFGGPDFRSLMIASVDKFLRLATKVTGMLPPPLLARES